MDNNTESLVIKSLERIENKMDVQTGTINQLAIIAAQQHVSLEEHSKRSTTAEENIALIRADIKPIQKHVQMISGGLKLIGFTATILAALGAVFEAVVTLLQYLRH